MTLVGMHVPGLAAPGIPVHPGMPVVAVPAPVPGTGSVDTISRYHFIVAATAAETWDPENIILLKHLDFL